MIEGSQLRIEGSEQDDELWVFDSWYRTNVGGINHDQRKSTRAIVRDAGNNTGHRMRAGVPLLFRLQR